MLDRDPECGECAEVTDWLGLGDGCGVSMGVSWGGKRDAVAVGGRGGGPLGLCESCGCEADVDELDDEGGEGLTEDDNWGVAIWGLLSRPSLPADAVDATGFFPHTWWWCSQSLCWQKDPQYRAVLQPLQVSLALRPQFQQLCKQKKRH